MKNLGLALIFACVVVPASTLAQNAYITNNGANTVSVIATASNTVVGSPIPVGLAPLGVAVTPDRRKGFVANHASNTVSAIDTATNAVSATISIGASPFGVAVTPDGTKAYVAHDSTPGAVSVIDIATNMVVGSQIPVSAPAVGVAVAPDGSNVYVTTAIRAGRGIGGVSASDAATHTVVTPLFLPPLNDRVGGNPHGRQASFPPSPKL